MDQSSLITLPTLLRRQCLLQLFPQTAGTDGLQLGLLGYDLLPRTESCWPTQHWSAGGNLTPHPILPFKDQEMNSITFTVCYVVYHGEKLRDHILEAKI